MPYYSSKLFSQVQAVAYEAESIALFARMTTQPSTALKTLINKTIIDLKDAGIWAKLDVITFYSTHTEQAGLLNWIKTSNNQINVNSLPHTPKIGFINADGAARYINSTFQSGTNYILDNALYGVYIEDNADNAERTVIGVRDSGLRSAYTRNNFTTVSSSGSSINSADALVAVGHSTYGMFSVERINSTHIRKISNGAVGANVASASVSIPTRDFWITIGQGFTVLGYAKHKFRNSWFGGALTDAQHSLFYNIVKNFNDNVGGTF